jgi:hypothetical protein
MLNPSRGLNPSSTAGGAAADSHRAALQKVVAEIAIELRELYPILEKLRVPSV